VRVGEDLLELLVFYSEIGSQKGPTVLFDTPGFPVHKEGFTMKYSDTELELFHFEHHQG
jgi:hypothetical protein